MADLVNISGLLDEGKCFDLVGCDSTLCGLWWRFGEGGKPDHGDDETE